MGERLDTITARPVCILGMHRSGTSCLTGSLEERGLFLGDVVNHAPHNIKGNKESLVVRSINDAVLEMSAGRWDSPPKELIWDDGLRRKRDSFIAQFKPNVIWGFKDPRTVLTLPFWLEALPDMQFCGTFRRADLVVASLFQRSRENTPTQYLSLWMAYNRRMLRYTKEHDMHLVCFDWEEDEYLEAVGNVAEALGLQRESCEDHSFFDRRLRSASLPPECATMTGTPAENLYNELLAK